MRMYNVYQVFDTVDDCWKSNRRKSKKLLAAINGDNGNAACMEIARLFGIDGQLLEAIETKRKK